MTERAEALVTKFEAANNDVIATVEAASDEQWAAICAAEGYPLLAGLI